MKKKYIVYVVPIRTSDITEIETNDVFCRGARRVCVRYTPPSLLSIMIYFRV